MGQIISKSSPGSRWGGIRLHLKMGEIAKSCDRLWCTTAPFYTHGTGGKSQGGSSGKTWRQSSCVHCWWWCEWGQHFEKAPCCGTEYMKQFIHFEPLSHSWASVYPKVIISETWRIYYYQSDVQKHTKPKSSTVRKWLRLDTTLEE